MVKEKNSYVLFAYGKSKIMVWAFIFCNGSEANLFISDQQFANETILSFFSSFYS